MKKVILFLFTMVSAVFTCQQTPQMETYQLKNGVKIYLMKYGKIEAMNILININSGKKNEIPGQQGYNDIVARMVLLGNTKYTEEQQNDKISAIGSGLTSRSNFDVTSISGNFLSKDANVAFDLISAAVRQPLFSKEKTDQYVSYLINYNNPAKMDIDQITSIYSDLAVHGVNNPLGRSIYKRQLQQITPERLKEFHKFNYTPKNTSIVVCGNYKSEEIKKLLENYFGDWQSVYGETNDVALDEPRIKEKEYFFINRTAATQAALEWTKPAPSLKDKDVLAFGIANMLFNQILFKEIREIGGKTYSIGSAHVTSKFSNLMIVGCSVRSNELYNTMELFDKTLLKFYNDPLNPADFENEITRFIVRNGNLEFPNEVSGFYNPIKYDFKKRQNVISEVAQLKIEDVQKAIKKYFNPNFYKLVVSGDEAALTSQLSRIKGLKKYTLKDLEEQH